MTDIEKLLQPRYKVIALFPYSPYPLENELSIGTVLIYDNEFFKSIEGWCKWVDRYPAVFKKLEWWEDRKVEDMPEYVRIAHYPNGENDFEIVKIDGDLIKHDFTEIGYFGLKYKNSGGLIYSCFIPASSEDYNQYIQSKQNQSQ